MIPMMFSFFLCLCHHSYPKNERRRIVKQDLEKYANKLASLEEQKRELILLYRLNQSFHPLIRF